MAAAASVTSLLDPGDHIVLSDDVYGGTYRLIVQALRRFGITHTLVDTSNLDAIRAAFTPATRMVWIETPTNPYLKIVPLTRLAEEAHERGVLVAVDNTFASPYLQRPLELGADVVVHSTTKYIGGHSDLLGGAIVGRDAEMRERLHLQQRTYGAVPGPMDCFLALRGLRTLAVRMERHCANAAAVTDFLVAHDAVAEVFYPGLSGHPGHAVAAQQMAGYGGMVSATLVGGAEAARRFVSRTRLFILAMSLGGVESLCELPALMTHATMAASEYAVDPALVRLSVGLEHCEDLIADLEQALESKPTSARSSSAKTSVPQGG